MEIKSPNYLVIDSLNRPLGEKVVTFLDDGKFTKFNNWKRKNNDVKILQMEVSTIDTYRTDYGRCKCKYPINSVTLVVRIPSDIYDKVVFPNAGLVVAKKPDNTDEENNNGQ